jgi:hypothetical protein
MCLVMRRGKVFVTSPHGMRPHGMHPHDMHPHDMRPRGMRLGLFGIALHDGELGVNSEIRGTMLKDTITN